jgi:hypothetical protein
MRKEDGFEYVSQTDDGYRVLPNTLVDGIREALSIGMEPQELIERLVPIVNCMYLDVKMMKIQSRKSK